MQLWMINKCSNFNLFIKIQWISFLSKDDLLSDFDQEFLFFDVIHDFMLIVQMNQITTNFIKRFWLNQLTTLSCMKTINYLVSQIND